MPSIEGQQPPDVASNLRRIRQEHRYSLETLAKLSGVSRAMLGQIETGKSVPTITLVWRVAKALGVQPADLISSPTETRSVLLPRSRQRTILHSNGRFQLRPFSALEMPLPFEVSELRLEAGHREELAPLGHGARAVLIVVTGSLEVAIAPDDTPSRLKEGDAILFHTDMAHALFNPDSKEAIAHLIVASRRNGGA